MKLPPCLLVTLVLAALCAQALGQQGTVPVNPAPPGNSAIATQDLTVKILGDVANGPPLPPIAHVGPGPVNFQRLWGPRSYAASGHVVNFSFRGTLGAAGSEQVMLGGFVVGPGGRVVLLRAVGPTLTRLGVAGAVARPQLELFDSTGRSLARAVAWSATSSDTRMELAAATALVGAFLLTSGSEDQVLLAYLPAGAYTCAVSNRDAPGGTCLLEGYEVPNDPAFQM